MIPIGELLSSGSQENPRRCSKRRRPRVVVHNFLGRSTVDFNAANKSARVVDNSHQNSIAAVQAEGTCKESDSDGQKDKFYVLERPSREDVTGGTNDTFESENGKEGVTNSATYIVPSTKICIFCHNGDLPGESWLPNPLIIRTTKDTIYTQWVHVNCAAFSSQVYSKILERFGTTSCETSEEVVPCDAFAA